MVVRAWHSKMLLPKQVTHSVRTMNRLELVGETFRAALNELARVTPDWLKPRIKPHWLDWFVQRRLEKPKRSPSARMASN